MPPKATLPIHAFPIENPPWVLLPFLDPESDIRPCGGGCWPPPVMHAVVQYLIQQPTLVRARVIELIIRNRSTEIAVILTRAMSRELQNERDRGRRMLTYNMWAAAPQIYARFLKPRDANGTLIRNQVRRIVEPHQNASAGSVLVISENGVLRF